MSAHPGLERIGPGRVAIVRGATRVEITGYAADRIATWHEHMSTHGEAWAATYLAGVVDGMRAAHEMRLDELVSAAEARLAKGRAAIAEFEARQQGRAARGEA
jgi:hypothetical protein